MSEIKKLSRTQKDTLERYYEAYLSSNRSNKDAAKALGITGQTFNTYKYKNKDVWEEMERAHGYESSGIPDYLKKRKVPIDKSVPRKENLNSKYIGKAFEIGQKKPVPKLKRLENGVDEMTEEVQNLEVKEVDTKEVEYQDKIKQLESELENQKDENKKLKTARENLEKVALDAMADYEKLSREKSASTNEDSMLRSYLKTVLVGVSDKDLDVLINSALIISAGAIAMENDHFKSIFKTLMEEN